jgi:glycerol-3-phosphate dehydrogenase
VAVRDAADPSQGTLEIEAPVLVNAAGPWADALRTSLGLQQRLRLLRGGHLIFPQQRLPLTRAVSFLHPQDGRPVFAVPWEGVVLLGTTDVDQGPRAEYDPAISRAEAAYLLQAAQYAFPSLELAAPDILASYEGIRAVIGRGAGDPSRQPRDHAIWLERGLLSLTGGKLTTFRLMAHDALRALRRQLPAIPRPERRQHLFGDAGPDSAALAPLEPSLRLRLLGRYGREAAELVRRAPQESWLRVPGTPYLWAELWWACRAEGVQHLEDLALRRVRLGLLAPDGGAALLQSARPMLQRALEWDDPRWEQELDAYRKLWARAYAPPALP